jgi:bifunctional N-acetylglucosamine-1-phosphate-uridyltransferase/glucosamine-1-phosphate-acetyltransferase GlmU-like protein
MFSGAKIAHVSFVGDSIIGSRANIEAGAIVANYRNELEDKLIRIRWNGQVIETGVDKFGALIGDDARVGANAVIAPGALLDKKTVVRRASLLDQFPSS